MLVESKMLRYSVIFVFFSFSLVEGKSVFIENEYPLSLYTERRQAVTNPMLRSPVRHVINKWFFAPFCGQSSLQSAQISIAGYRFEHFLPKTRFVRKTGFVYFLSFFAQNDGQQIDYH